VTGLRARGKENSRWRLLLVIGRYLLAVLEASVVWRAVLLVVVWLCATIVLLLRLLIGLLLLVTALVIRILRRIVRVLALALALILRRILLAVLAVLIVRTRHCDLRTFRIGRQEVEVKVLQTCG
jgi:hypothetical protein